MKKRILSLLLAFVLLVGLLPAAVLAEEPGDPTKQVHVIVENTTFTSAVDGKEPAWKGTLVDEWVTLTSTSTMMGCVVEALGDYSQTGAESNYISEINGLKAFDGGNMSGWMGTLNDWFTSEGYGAYTVADGTLAAGDEIRIMYTCNGYGADLGGSWENNDKTVKALTFTSGTLAPGFDKDTHAYTLTVPADTTGVMVTPTASNKNFQVRTFVGETEYKRTATVPVVDGTVITVKCGDPSWPSMNAQAGGTAAAVAAQVYTITVKLEGAAPAVVNYLSDAYFSQKPNDGIYAMTPAFDPAVTEYTVTIPDNVTNCYIKLAFDGAPEGTTAKYSYTDKTGKSRTNAYKDNPGGRILISFLTASYTGGTVSVAAGVGGDTKTYTFTVVRAPANGKLLLTSSTALTAADTDTYFASNKAGTYTVDLPYDGAYLTWTTTGNDTIKVNGAVFANGSKLDATSLWMGEAGNRQFPLTVSIEPENAEAASITYDIICRERAELTVKTAPAKTEYVVGDSFDPTDMELLYSYHEQAAPVDLGDVTFSPSLFREADENAVVTATYNGVSVKVTVCVRSPFPQEGTEEDPYILKTADDLRALSKAVAAGSTYAGKQFRIADNITLPDSWTPIGSLKEGKTWSASLKSAGYNLFCGSIDGAKNDGSGECWTITVPKGSKTMLGAVKNCTISNLNIYGEQIEGYGVVEYYHNGASGIVIDNVTLKSGSHTKYSGFIGGYASGSNPVLITNCTVEAGVVIGDDGTIPGWAEDVQQTYQYDFVSAKTQYNDMIGSFAGAFNGTIENSVSHAKVYGHDYVGGMMGFKGQSMGICVVRGCVFDGQVIATGEYVGGIMGSGYAASSAPNTPCVTIENCAVTGSVTGGNNVGGIFGGNSKVTSTFNNGIGYIRGNYFNGTLAATAGDVVGGIIGHINQIIIYNIINNNYYLNTAAAKGIGSMGVYGRPDDPTGADAEKLAAPFTASELSMLDSKLNAAGAGGRAWTSGPSLTSDQRVVRMTCDTLNDMTPKTFRQSEGLTVLDQHSVTVSYYDGSSETIKAIQCKVGGLDLSTAGLQLASLTYKDYTLYFGVEVETDGAASDETIASVAISKINGIGAVTADSEGVIQDARETYDALTDAQRALVPAETLKVLTDAEAALVTAKADKAAADAVAAQIAAIGEVTLDSKDEIEAAENAYNALTEEQKKLVGNYQKLVDAREAYNQLAEDAQKPVFPDIPVTPGKPGTTEPEKPAEAVKFSDVKASDWYYESVMFVCENGLMNGTGNGQFSPNANTTRGMIVTILARLEGVDTTKGSNWYEAGQQWAMENGISDGTSMTGEMTREQLATMLYRYAQLKGYATTASADLSTFADAGSVSDWAQDAMQWAVGMGLIQGSDNQLTPTAPATRAQIAAILMRFMENVVR